MIILRPFLLQIQPEMFHFHNSGAMEAPASGSVRALIGAPTLSQASEHTICFGSEGTRQ